MVAVHDRLFVDFFAFFVAADFFFFANDLRFALLLATG